MTELINETKIETVKVGDSKGVLVGGKLLCDMANGTPKRYRNEIEALVTGKSYARGNNGGSFLTSDLANWGVNE